MRTGELNKPRNGPSSSAGRALPWPGPLGGAGRPPGRQRGRTTWRAAGVTARRGAQPPSRFRFRFRFRRRRPRRHEFGRVDPVVGVATLHGRRPRRCRRFSVAEPSKRTNERRKTEWSIGFQRIHFTFQNIVSIKTSVGDE